jgi:beta-glucosidase
MKKYFIIILKFSISVTAYGQQDIDIEQKVDAVLARMTLQQKIGQLNQLDGRGMHGTVSELKQLINTGKVGSIMNITDPNITNELQQAAIKESQTGIPLLFTRDVVHGFKTMLPIPLGQAATFNPDLIMQASRMAAAEATEHGVRWSFAPMIDIARDARWGRIAESFGEDTYLTSAMAKAVVRGYQGQDLSNPKSMAACLKHFVGYGAAEGGRDYNSTYIPERQLRDVYFPPFKQAIDVGAASVMTSFNDNDGIPVSGNKYLLTNVLRKEWGFDGVVVSDWGSVTEMVKHGFVTDSKHAAEKAINAGLDVEMASKSFINHLEKLINEGRVTEDKLDDAVRNVLRLKFRLGLFSKPYTNVTKNPETYSATHLAIAKKVAEESVVLLKNEGSILPLKGNVKSILITGPLADAPHDQLGTWTMDGETDKTQTPAKAIAAMYGEKVKVRFIDGLAYSRDKDTTRFNEVTKIARSVDAIISFIGEEAILTGEAHSLATLHLQGAQSQLISRLKSTGKPLVTVVMAGRPLTIGPEIKQSNAVLYAWHPGTMGGPAIADILFGKNVPMGKLPVTFPKESGQIPIYYNHKNTGRPAKGNEKSLEEIPINAKQSVLGHSSYYLDIGSKPLYPFGYGLSYTTFEYDGLKLENEKLNKMDTLSVSINIKNTGSLEGTEVVQLYISDVVGSVTRPEKELKGFQHIKLKAGEKGKVNFNIPLTELAFWNAEMKHEVESGKFKVMVGTNSETGITGYFEVL